ncbi:MAG: carboxylesterase family protein, partial [Dehalococcoidia bacterium]
FKKLGISTGGNVLEQARSIPPEKILQVSQSMETPRIPGTDLKPLWDAAVDGWVLPQSPTDSFNSDSCNASSLIAVANLGELLGPGPLVVPWLIPAYVGMLEAVTRQGYKGYACIFDKVPAGWRKQGCGSFHSIELPYVFGDWDNSTGWWKRMHALIEQSGIKGEDPGLDASDKTVSEAIMNLWTEFARIGKPQAPGVPDWLPYSSATDSYLYINKTTEVKTGYSRIIE